MTPNEKVSVYDVVTDRICKALESGTVPWRRPWKGVATSAPRNLVSNKPYSGINTFLLGLSALTQGYEADQWLTFKQAIDRGGSVRKGEKGTPCFFWKTYEGKGKDKNGDPESRWVARYYTVFNVEQTDGVEYVKPLATVPNPIVQIDRCEAIASGFDGPEIRHQGGRACYSPIGDVITMPEVEKFDLSEEYYSTLFHEMTHATGHHSRLARFPQDGAPLAHFGSADYSKEELVAEMGAAFLCGHAQIDNATIDNSAAYIANWLKVLKNDKKAVVFAAAQAQKAANLILGVKRETEGE